VATILLALAIPVGIFWRDTTTSLRVQAYVQPASPIVGEATHVVIVASNGADRADILGPSAQIAARWDMLTMTMGVREVVLPDLLSHKDALSLPLRLDMAGPWWIQVAVQVPGRPLWQTRLEITVQSPASSVSTNQQVDALADTSMWFAQQQTSMIAKSATSLHQTRMRGFIRTPTGCAMCLQNQEIRL
jgi:hypothetical protein